jgi:hypothetical protein
VVVDGNTIHRWCVDAGDFEGGCSGQRAGTGEFADYVPYDLSGPFFIGGFVLAGTSGTQTDRRQAGHHVGWIFGWCTSRIFVFERIGDSPVWRRW